MSRQTDKLAIQTADAVIAADGRIEKHTRRIDELAGGPAQRIRAAELGSRLEDWASRKLAPRTRRSERLAAYDERVAELEERQRHVLERMNALHEQIPQAEREHQAALTTWHRDARGTRPDSPIPALEGKLRLLEEDYRALDVLIDEALAEKASWVEAHRDALVRDARSAVDEANATYLDAIEGVAKARAELLAARRDELWAELYPDPTVRSEPPAAMLVGGIISRLRAAVPGLQITLGMPELRRLLEADAEFVASMRTRDQEQALRARDSDAARPTDAALWVDTPEYQEQVKRETQAARQRYFNDWGVWPS